MNLTELENKLFAAVRSNPPDDRVPYAFEQRVLARIRALKVRDVWAVWSEALWRASAPCVSLMLLLAAWSWFVPAPVPPPGDLSQDFENTLLSAVDRDSSVDAAQ